MSILAIIGTIIGFVALACVCMAGTLVLIGYVEELDLADRLFEYGEKLARKRRER